MQAISTVYRSIYISEMAVKLGVPHGKAESIAAAMIADGSLRGSIDQVSGLVEFHTYQSPNESWDKAITSFCLELNKITETVQTH